MTARFLYLDGSVEEYLIRWQQGEFDQYHNWYKIRGFNQYNLLLEFNYHIAPNDFYALMDRTQTVALPYQYAVSRPWQPPRSNPSLEEFFESRTKTYINTNQKINIFWSGGIDSTAIVVAFLNHCQNFSQLRIIYTNESVQENLQFFKLLEALQIDLYQLTLHRAITDQLDGVHVNGMSLDERIGEINQKGFLTLGPMTLTDVLSKPWQDFFLNQPVSADFFDFFESWFDQCTRPIKTLLEARWWFYLQTQTQSAQYDVPRFVSQMFEQQDVNFCFYDCDQFDDYVFHNLDSLFPPRSTYHHYKLFLKKYIQTFDKNIDYYNFAIKLHSVGWKNIGIKADLVKNQCWSFILDDMSYHGTENLPLLSINDLEMQFGNRYDSLFNFGRSC